MTDAQLATLWQEAQARVVHLARYADDLDLKVPATPAWSVKDLVGHMAGVGLGAVAGTEVAGHPPEWTEQTVAERRDMTIDQVLREWSDGVPAVVDLIRSGDKPGLLIDLVVHEQDLRGALHEPGFRESAPLEELCLDGFADAAADLPALEVLGRAVGSGPSAGTVGVSAFEFTRAVFGRRSEAQVRAWDWPVDPTPWLPVVCRYGDLRDSDLVE